MKYKLLKDLPGVKAGFILEINGETCSFGSVKEFDYNFYKIFLNESDWFELIDERQEELKQKIKDVEAAGYVVFRES